MKAEGLKYKDHSYNPYLLSLTVGALFCYLRVSSRLYSMTHVRIYSANLPKSFCSTDHKDLCLFYRPAERNFYMPLMIIDYQLTNDFFFHSSTKVNIDHVCRYVPPFIIKTNKQLSKQNLQDVLQILGKEERIIYVIHVFIRKRNYKVFSRIS